jgi:hypothetical protein
VDPLISYLSKVEELGYRINELGSTIIQTYADYKILVYDSRQNLQILTCQTKNFLDLADIIHNPSKYDVNTINPHKEDNNVSINDIMNEYATSNKFIKYLGYRWNLKE